MTRIVLFCLDLVGTVVIVAVCGPTPLGFAALVVWWLLIAVASLDR